MELKLHHVNYATKDVGAVAIEGGGLARWGV